MKRITILTAVLALGLGVQVAAAQRTTDEERRELERRLRELQQEMREIERKLGRPRAFVDVSGDIDPVVVSSMRRPRLGVIVASGRRPETDSIGALLQAVTPEGPAYKAGLRGGDVVVRFGDESLANARPDPGERLIDLARQMEEGDTVQVRYRRGTETRTATVVPELLDDFAFSFVMPALDSSLRIVRELAVDSALRGAVRAMERARVVERRAGLYPFFGLGERWSDMELVELSPELGSYFGTDEGLLVVRAPRGELLQLKSGDVILRIGGRVPSSPSHAARILRSYEPGDELRLEIMRNKRREEIRVVLPAGER